MVEPQPAWLEEWQDLEPVLLAPGKVVEIDYSPVHRLVLEYFLALLSSGETSLRALRLTEQVIDANPASYTGWEHRWRCLVALELEGEVREGERAFMRRQAAAGAKNYQLWNHRRRFAAHLGASNAPEVWQFFYTELRFAAECLRVDAKNYHAWAHRQAVVATHGLWAEELCFVTEMLEEDVRNNSAWNQRFWVVCAQPAGSEDEAAVEQEVTFCCGEIARAPYNESAWAYLRGLGSLQACNDLLACSTAVQDVCLEVLARFPSCPLALDCLAAVYEAQLRLAADDGDADARELICESALECYGRLAVADPLRGNYWRHCRGRVERLAACRT